MTEDASRLRCQCPACGQSYHLPASYAGKSAKCAKCGGSFRIGTAPPPAPAPAPALGASADAPAASRSPASASAVRETIAAAHDPQAGDAAFCIICQTAIQEGEATTLCPDCKTTYHTECWQENRGCAVYGCPQVPPTEKLSTLEMPASYWGKEEKNCPQCNRVIQAAAVRCRFCGATFQSARPETATDFHTRRVKEENLPRVRKTGIWFLVLGLVPCTAPIVAVAGPIWYNHHKKEIQSLPGIQTGICRIAVLAALVQTALLVLFGVLSAAFH